MVNHLISQPHQKEVSALRYYDLLKFLENKNRTIVSQDMGICLNRIRSYSEIPMKIHKYPTGKDYSTWKIPKQWDLRGGQLLDAKGNVLVDSRENPLFVVPYSTSFHGRVSKKDLKEHTSFHFKRSDAFYYEHRYAMDDQKRLSDWRVTLPRDLFDSLSDNELYEVRIEVEVKDGKMLIGDFTLPGNSKRCFSILTNLCHLGQVNDSLSGIPLGLEIMNRLLAQKKRKYTYQLLIMPETIGSSVYLTANRHQIKNYIGSIFPEALGKGDELCLKGSTSGGSYVDEVMLNVQRHWKNTIRKFDFFLDGYGNDEIVFNSQNVNIPSLAIHRYPFEEYHSSLDRLEIIDFEKLQECIDIVWEMVQIMERDYIPQFTTLVTPHLSRFSLYNDAIYDRERAWLARKIIQEANGHQTVLAIANKVSVSFTDVWQYLEQFIQHHLVKKIPHVA